MSSYAVAVERMLCAQQMRSLCDCAHVTLAAAEAVRCFFVLVSLVLLCYE